MKGIPPINWFFYYWKIYNSDQSYYRNCCISWLPWSKSWLQSTFASRKSADTAVSIITLVGVVNLPIVKKSVDWWNTLHQPASISISGESSISNEMLVPLLFSILGVYLFVLFTGLLSMRAEISSREQNKEWFKKLLSKN